MGINWVTCKPFIGGHWGPHPTQNPWTVRFTADVPKFGLGVSAVAMGDSATVFLSAIITPKEATKAELWNGCIWEHA